MSALPQNAAEALTAIASVEFRPFDDSDWSAWAGCVSDNPMIGEYGGICVIIDDATVTFNLWSDSNGEAEWVNFTLNFDRG
jgi:hypothetical protein